MGSLPYIQQPSLEDYIATDQEARIKAKELI
jgi:hypothetical protein